MKRLVFILCASVAFRCLAADSAIAPMTEKELVSLKEGTKLEDIAQRLGYLQGTITGIAGFTLPENKAEEFVICWDAKSNRVLGIWKHSKGKHESLVPIWPKQETEKKEPNQPLQRNASTGSVSNFQSPARRG